MRTVDMMYYKYTYKKKGDEFATQYYGGTKRDANTLRELMAQKLNLAPELLWLAPRNIPYKIRKKLLDEKNTEFVLTVVDEQEPQEFKSLEDRQSELFGSQHSEIKSINFKIRNLFYPTKEFCKKFSNYQDWTKLYHDIRNQILRSDKLKDKEYVNGFTYLEFVDSFITNFNGGYNVKLNIEKKR